MKPLTTDWVGVESRFFVFQISLLTAVKMYNNFHIFPCLQIFKVNDWLVLLNISYVEQIQRLTCPVWVRIFSIKSWTGAEAWPALPLVSRGGHPYILCRVTLYERTLMMVKISLCLIWVITLGNYSLLHILDKFNICSDPMVYWKTTT